MAEKETLIGTRAERATVMAGFEGGLDKKKGVCYSITITIAL